jgi:Protein of unknown function (DUF3299)
VRLADRLLLLLATAACLGALAWGAGEVRGGGAAPRPGLAFRPFPPPPPDLAARLAAPEGAGSPGGAASPTLPPGLRIDPKTLQLVGLDLKADPGGVVAEWDLLRSWKYQEGLVGLPETIRALDGKKVTMAGFLLPLYEFDDIHEFNLVASHWSCCFGVPPGVTGWVHVRLAAGQTGLPNTSEPLRVSGTFHVAPKKEAGFVVSVWALDDAKASIIGW